MPHLVYKPATVILSLVTLGIAQQAVAVLPTVTADPSTVTRSANSTDAPTLNTALPAQFMVAPAQPIMFNQAMTNPIAAQAPASVNQTTPISQLFGSQNTNPNPNLINSQLTPRILASIVTRDAQGQESLTPVDAQTVLTRGNLIEYRAYLTNTSPDRVRSVKVTMGIPTNMELTSLADIAPTRPYGSIDGVNFQYMPLKTNVGGVLQEIPMSSYKAVRWSIEGLGLNEVAEVKFRAQVK